MYATIAVPAGSSALFPVTKTEDAGEDCYGNGACGACGGCGASGACFMGPAGHRNSLVAQRKMDNAGKEPARFAECGLFLDFGRFANATGKTPPCA